jgi:hypothetical protein
MCPTVLGGIRTGEDGTVGGIQGFTKGSESRYRAAKGSRPPTSRAWKEAVACSGQSPTNRRQISGEVQN